MSEGFSKLKGRRSQLPDPPTDATQNLQAPEVAPLPPAPSNPIPATQLPGRPSAQPSGRLRIDGRARLRKDRTEALSTKIKPHHRDLLMSLADAYDGTLSETLERAIEALEIQAKRDGIL